MRGKTKVFGGVLAGMAILGTVFAGGYFYFNNQVEKSEPIYVETASLSLPTEVEKMYITKNDVEIELKEVGELSTYSGGYEVVKGAECARYMFDKWAFPGTTNVIEVTCEGIVKVGYAIEDTEVVVDNDSQKIYVGLPEAKVNDNYIIWDSVECVEGNSMFNPIEFWQYEQLLHEIEVEGLAQVEAEGIYEKAEENAQRIISKFLSGFDEFEVVFV